MQQEGSSGSVVGEKIGEATEVISARAGDVAEQGRGMVRRQIGQRSVELSGQADEMSRRMRQVADQARSEGNDQQARLVEGAARQTERASAYLGDLEPDRLLADVEGFARREPWLVAGVGVAIGFVFARSLKASSGRRSTREYRYAGRPVESAQRRPVPQPAPVGVTSDPVGVGARDEW
jgi:hypothetical protein